MRIEIKTKTPVKDKDIKALYILDAAMRLSTDRMRIANLTFVANKYGFTVTPTATK